MMLAMISDNTLAHESRERWATDLTCRFRARMGVHIMDRGMGSAWGGADGVTTATENGHVHLHGGSDAVTEQPTVRVASAASVVTITATEKKVGPPQPSAPAISAAPAKPWLVRNLHLLGIGALVIIQAGLLIISFLPARVVLNLGWSASNGPFPASTAPAVTAVFYLLPFIIGLLARKWELALFAATLPAWLAVGIFSMGESIVNGSFFFLKNNEPNYLVGTIELFAALGFFGWLAHRVVAGDRATR